MLEKLLLGEPAAQLKVGLNKHIRVVLVMIQNELVGTFQYRLPPWCVRLQLRGL